MKVNEGPVAGLYSNHGAPGQGIPGWPSTTGKPVKVVKVVKVKEKAVKVNTQLHKSSESRGGTSGWTLEDQPGIQPLVPRGLSVLLLA